jgi:ABC-2 type transport system ATP-binding protein
VEALVMLEVNRIEKVYNSGRGLKCFSLIIEKAEILCLIGPNGSGKSTALNIISGIVKADKGSCLLNNLNTHDLICKKNIGFLEETPFYYDRLSIFDFLDFIWDIKYPGESNAEIYRLLDKFDLMSIKGIKIKELSFGLKKRIGVISAIMNYPQLIILDEPTNGMDAKSVIVLKEEIFDAYKHDSYIIISSHILDFLKDIGTKIVFLKDGEIKENILNTNVINLDDIYRSLYM